MPATTHCTLTDTGLVLPAAWCERLVGARIQAQAIGASRADVFRVQRSNAPDWFLKSEPADAFSELPDEIARLRWLQTQEVPAARVVDVVDDGARHWLLMSAVAGADLASSPALTPLQAVTLLADALLLLHRLPVAACPFDHRLPRRLAAARARVEAGRVDASDFDDERAGQSAAQVLEQLLVQPPMQADLVVTHGDACLPNVLADGGRFTGFIDCARLGVADRHQDLALAARSIALQFGATWVAPFFARYAVVPDPSRLAFYRGLDELF